MMRQLLILLLPAVLLACGGDPASAPEPSGDPSSTAEESARPAPEVATPRPDIYAPFTLTADLSHLSNGQREMIAVLIEASAIMDDLFWRQAYGDRDELLGRLEGDAERFARFNYGPWDRLAGDDPFVAGIGPKPLGANLYPADMTREEFEAADLAGKDDLYTIIRRNDAGELEAVPYHVAFEPELVRAAELLREASELAEHAGFATYLKLRADALLSGEYLESDMAWMDTRGNPVELVYGPIETYEDKLFGYKAAFESYVLIKDLAWSERLAHFADFMPGLQAGLPVPDAYKAEIPGTDADLNAYDVVYYAGDCNAGSKTIAINLPNDERVQLEKGTRRLQLKNAMRAKFDEILVPLADVLIAEDQRDHITFEAFFSNTMFHEVAHGLGIKNTLDGAGTVRQALKETSSPIEEGKADILGLYMVTELFEQGEIADGEVMDNYVTFLAGIFRSVRFGASSAHGRANMVRFNYFAEAGAFSRDEQTGTYRVNFDAMQVAMADLGRLILTIQGDGDYERAVALLDEQGVISPGLQADLHRLNDAGIPVDVVFEQGADVLGL